MTTYTASMKSARDTAANWTANNPTLLIGEIGVETDTLKAKIGDGSTAWNSLDYWIDFVPTSGLTSSTDITVDTATPNVVTWTLANNAKTRSITIIIGDGTNVITTAMKAMVCVPYACTIISHDLVSLDSTAAALSGSIVLDVWKDTYANWPPTNADSITASAKPTLSSASKATDSTLTGWTTSISAGDYLVVEVESITTCKQVILTLKVRTT